MSQGSFLCDGRLVHGRRDNRREVTRGWKIYDYVIVGGGSAGCPIMPEIVSGNTNAPIIMIGENASDLIRKDSRR